MQANTCTYSVVEWWLAVVVGGEYRVKCSSRPQAGQRVTGSTRRVCAQCELMRTSASACHPSGREDIEWLAYVVAVVAVVVVAQNTENLSERVGNTRKSVSENVCRMACRHRSEGHRERRGKSLCLCQVSSYVEKGRGTVNIKMVGPVQVLW